LAAEVFIIDVVASRGGFGELNLFHFRVLIALGPKRGAHIVLHGHTRIHQVVARAVQQLIALAAGAVQLGSDLIDRLV
jgi:predicted phosphodiesterase